MGIYVRWIGAKADGFVYDDKGCTRRNDQVVLLFRFMEEERVWLLMRRMGFEQGIRIDPDIVVDLIEQFHTVTYEYANGIHWNSGPVRTELERTAEEFMRFDRIDSYTHCPVVG